MQKRIIPSLRAKVSIGTIRRFLFLWAIALWLGGFTFYTGVVIHVGGRVLGSHLKQGFITEKVTNWLNVIGIIALPILLWNTAAIWHARGRMLRRTLVVTWGVMLLVQVELLVLHLMMDRLLDPQARKVLDDARFERLHLVYVVSATAQWAAGVLHVFCAMNGAEV